MNLYRLLSSVEESDITAAQRMVSEAESERQRLLGELRAAEGRRDELDSRRAELAGTGPVARAESTLRIPDRAARGPARDGDDPRQGTSHGRRR